MTRVSRPFHQTDASFQTVRVHIAAHVLTCDTFRLLRRQVLRPLPTPAREPESFCPSTLGTITRWVFPKCCWRTVHTGRAGWNVTDRPPAIWLRPLFWLHFFFSVTAQSSNGTTHLTVPKTQRPPFFSEGCLLVEQTKPTISSLPTRILHLCTFRIPFLCDPFPVYSSLQGPPSVWDVFSA